MTDVFRFENIESNENAEPVIVGGASVATMLRKNKHIFDVEGSLFTRFTNLVVPIGLQMYPTAVNEDNEMDNNEPKDNEPKSIDTKKFDQLFYSVGKDLGISKERTYKNRTMKNPTK